MCDSKELLVGFLYDEIDPVSKRTFERHLKTCADCRDELAELAVRTQENGGGIRTLIHELTQSALFQTR